MGTFEKNSRVEKESRVSELKNKRNYVGEKRQSIVAQKGYVRGGHHLTREREAIA